MMEADSHTRFPFGRNWRHYASHVSEERIQAAERSLRDMLSSENLSDLRFLDAGCGSGLFSLAARRLGAEVHSFDYDPESVACTLAMRDGFADNGENWTIEQGSVLDADYMGHLGVFNIVYSWGVLHHTGRMWLALENCADRVDAGGRLFIAIYNDQGRLSQYWRRVKRLYNRGPVYRGMLLAAHAPYFVGLRWIVRRLRRRSPVERGMSLWYDMKDWLGGFPFEVARPEEVLAFLRPHGFELERLVTCGGRHGCNEYVFMKQ